MLHPVGVLYSYRIFFYRYFASNKANIKKLDRPKAILLNFCCDDSKATSGKLFKVLPT
jgi:hypothetical protein